MNHETTKRSIEGHAATMSQNVPQSPNGGGGDNLSDAQVPAGLNDAQFRVIESLNCRDIGG